MNNLDIKTVKSFGDEWTEYDQSKMSIHEAQKIFMEYFTLFPFELLNSDAEGFDMGCGSGRWARFIAPKVGKLNCIDPSSAIDVAKKNLIEFNNISFYRASVDEFTLAENSQDFGYSLGVLHHIPDTQQAITSCVKMLKKNAPFLVYIYYSFENKSLSYKLIWKLSDLLRKIIIKLPPFAKNFCTDLIALFIYFPLSRLSLIVEKMNLSFKNIPLSYYRHHSFFTLKTDSRDRFGTPLEKRFSKKEILEMLINSGLSSIQFSDNEPFWCAIGFKQ